MKRKQFTHFLRQLVYRVVDKTNPHTIHGQRPFGNKDAIGQVKAAGLWHLVTGLVSFPVRLSAISIHIEAEWRFILACLFLLLGGGLYLILPFELPVMLAIFIFIACLCLWFKAKQSGVDQPLYYLTGYLLIGVTGFLYTMWFTATLIKPVISLTPEYQTLSGQIVRIDHKNQRTIGQGGIATIGLIIKLDSPAHLAGQRAMISHRYSLGFASNHPVNIGDDITVGAMIKAPDTAVIPGGFEFDRHAFFNGITVTGFSVTVMDIYAGRTVNKRGYVDIILRQVDRQRHGFTNWLREKLGAREGGLAAALLVGRRDAVPDDITAAMRRAGMSHMLAISGLHMTLVTGMIFFLLESVFALIPALALRVTPRKLAAPFALICAAVYLLYSGQAVSAQRAFIMIAVILLALMLGRKAFSLRSLAIAGAIIFIVQPYAVITAGFQMSFAATAGLILYFNWRKTYKSSDEIDSIHAAEKDQNPGYLMTAARKISGLILSVFAMTSVAQLAILPVSLYHFHAFSPLAVITNLAMIPLLTFIIMPILLVLIILSMTTGVPEVFLTVTQACMEIMTENSLSFAALPIDTFHKVTIPAAGYGVVALTACYLLFLRPYWLGALVYTVGMITLLLWPPARLPDLYIVSSGKALISTVNGHDQEKRSIDLAYAGVRQGSFTDRVFRDYFGVPQGTIKKIQGNCGTGGCLYHVKGRSILISDEDQVIKKECGQVNIIIHASRSQCSQSLLISRNDLLQYGTHAVYFSYDQVSVTRSIPKIGYEVSHQAADAEHLPRKLTIKPYVRPWHMHRFANKTGEDIGLLNPFDMPILSIPLTQID